MASLGAGSVTESNALTESIGLTGAAAADWCPLDVPADEPSSRDARDRRLRAALSDSLSFLRRGGKQPAATRRRFALADLLPAGDS